MAQPAESAASLKVGLRLRWPWSRPRNLEKIALAAQRVSGLGLLLYLFLHVFITGTIAGGQQSWDSTQAALESPGWGTLEKIGTLLVIVGAVFHAVNGIRVMLLESTRLIGRPVRPDYPYKVQSAGKGEKTILYTAILMASLATLAGIVILWGL